MLTAYFAGLLTFFAPCHLPLVPAYVTYVAGVSLQAAEQNKKRLVMSSVSFVGGFLVIFVLLGIGASAIGRTLLPHRDLIRIIGGVLIILVGANLAGLFNIPWLNATKRMAIPQNVTRFAYLNSFLIGLAFGFSWTPCIGPVLAVILFWASQTESVWRGAILLFFYGLGLATPFFLISIGIGRATEWIKRYQSTLHKMTVVAGYILIMVGALLIGNWLNVISGRFIRFGSPELYFFDVR